MAFCSKCGSPIKDNFAFCTRCGAKIEASAPQQPPFNPSQPAPVQPPRPQVADDMATQAVFSGAQPVPQPVNKEEPKPQPVKKEEAKPVVKPENKPKFDESTKLFNVEEPKTKISVNPKDSVKEAPKAEPKQEAPKAEPKPAEVSDKTQQVSKSEEIKTPVVPPIATAEKDDDRTRTVSTAPNYERPPVQTYENQYDVPSGPESQLPLNTEPYQGKPDKKGEYGVVSALYYFLMTLLYAIPIVGLIMSIVMSFGGTVNQNKRGFARSVLIFKFIGILMLFAVLILGIMFKEDIFEYINNTFAWNIEAWGDIFKQF